MVVCSCLDELHQRIDASQLTIELGGCLFYNHQEWIDTRVVSRRLDDTLQLISDGLIWALVSFLVGGELLG